ncbi:MAG TPA: hypothetical protein VIH92_07210 [Solirubrobacteraceae bacterium]
MTPPRAGATAVDGSVARSAQVPVSPASPFSPAGLWARVERLASEQGTRWRAAAGVVLVPLAILLLSWHALALEPQPGLDASWEAALHMALHAPITFGRHLVFTYGPLGFLSVPTLWYSDTGTIAVLYAVLLRFALASALFMGARRTYGTIGGAIVALFVAGASDVALETVPFLVFCVWMVDQDRASRRRLALMALGGAVAGLELLNKQSVGIEIAVLAIIVALAARGRRRDHLLVTLAALIVALLAAWTVTGQEWGALPDYVRNAARIISGYGAAMSLEEPSLAWQYTAGWVAFAFGLAGALNMTVAGPTRRRWGIVSLWVAFCFFEYKEGFVRHDIGHGAIYFVAVMGGFLAFYWRRGNRTLGLTLLAALFAFAVAAQESSMSVVFDPDGDINTAVTQLEQVASSSQRQSIIAQGRQAIEAASPIDPQTLRLLQGHTVDVEPYEASLAWAYRFQWSPLPIFQSYSVYTTGLDQDNADALNSSSAPQRILRNLDPEIDGRVGAFEEGLTTRTILCRYEELRVTNAWQVLGRGPNRCTAPVPLGTVHANWGQAVAVPTPPNEQTFVFVRVGGAAVGGLERLYSLLYKPVGRTVLLDGVPHRLIEQTASDGLILRAPPGVDFTAPFNLAPNSTSIAVDENGVGSAAGDPITFSFYAQSMSVGPRDASLQKQIEDERGS